MVTSSFSGKTATVARCRVGFATKRRRAADDDDHEGDRRRRACGSFRITELPGVRGIVVARRRKAASKRGLGFNQRLGHG